MIKDAAFLKRMGRGGGGEGRGKGGTESRKRPKTAKS